MACPRGKVNTVESTSYGIERVDPGCQQPCVNKIGKGTLVFRLEINILDTRLIRESAGGEITPSGS